MKTAIVTGALSGIGKEGIGPDCHSAVFTGGEQHHKVTFLAVAQVHCRRLRQLFGEVHLVGLCQDAAKGKVVGAGYAGADLGDSDLEILRCFPQQLAAEHLSLGCRKEKS